MREPFRRWLEPRLSQGDYFGFIAELGGRPIGGIGLITLEWPPHPANFDPRRGYVLNVFVESAHRGRGVGRALLKAADEEFMARGIGYAILHAIDAGRPLYERTGWAATSEMAKPIRKMIETRRLPGANTS